MEIPPEKGFYYHYKHDAQKGVTDHAYEVIGVGLDTEDETYSVIYRPLYANDFLKEAEFCIRPLGMFMETVEKDGTTFRRFEQITDPSIIEELQKGI